MSIFKKLVDRLLDADKKDEPVRCPKCGSAQLTANKRGFNFKKAAVAGVLTMPLLGAVAGFHGRNRIVITCLSCGRQFSPGK